MKKNISENSENKDREHLQSLGIFAGSIAHDLNNMLTGILGHVSLLRLQLAKDGTHCDSLTAIEDAAKRSAAMTKQILEFARGINTDHQTVDFSRTVQDAINLLSVSAPNGVSLKYDKTEAKILVLGDESQLAQIILNLIVNAFEAFNTDGVIEVFLDEVVFGLQASDLELGLQAGNYARLTIRDNGSGIPEDIKPHIFEPFFTTKLNSGTGLGLATVFSIVKSHMGTIVVESEEGKGSQFQIFLPLQDSKPTTKILKKEKVKEQCDLPLGSETILIVDDEESVRTIMQRSLQHLGYSVEVAKNGVEALKAYQDDPDKFSLVILDMIMPQMAGDEVFFRLKELNNHVPVLMASGYSSDKKAKSVLTSGGLGFIQKPFAVDELAKEVRRCLDRG